MGTTDANRTQILSADPNRTQLGAAPVLDPNRTILGSIEGLNRTQTIKPVQCPVCKTFNPAAVIYCVDCGLIFERALERDAFGAPAVQVPQLVDSSGREHPVRPGETTVGREGDIALAEGKVSRRHAVLRFDGTAVSVEDMGSTNGTTVNGQALSSGERRSLQDGDRIAFGGVELRLAMPGGKSASATLMVGGGRTVAMAAPLRKEAAPAYLVGESGEEIALRTGTLTFGRRAENDWVVPDPYVSGKHGHIELDATGVYLTDLGSSNGTFVNEAKLGANMRTRLTPEDELRLGGLRFRLRLTEAG